ncbi:MAG TPA: hypothetical protein DCE55_00565 [Planctomycetaceae bacterium]|nr:hypothetical protein [Planctomycetaceae bacterium]
MHRTAFLSIGLMLVSVVAAGSSVAQEGESKSVVNEGGPQLVAPENLQLREVPLRDAELPTGEDDSLGRVQTVVRFTDSDGDDDDEIRVAGEPVPEKKRPVAVSPVNKQSPTRLTALDAARVRRRDRLRQCLSIYFQRREMAVERSPWGVMHSLIAYGVDTEIVAQGRSVNAIGWLCWNGACNGQRLFTRKRGRLGANVGPGFQGHDGQFLSMLAQSKVGRNYGLKVNGANFDVMDLVEYEQRTCRSGAELTFKLIGLSHYLPSDEEWENERGEVWDIPRLIEEELAQSVVDAACGGTHRIMGLSYAIYKRARRKEPFVGAWSRAKEYIEEFQDYTFTLQNRDASFSTNWFTGRGRDRDINRRMETTGHILEWLIFSLPQQDLLQPRVTRAVDYLTELMLQNRDHDWEIGPRGHALHALALYDERVFGSKPGDRAAVLEGRVVAAEEAVLEGDTPLRNAGRSATNR